MVPTKKNGTLIQSSEWTIPLIILLLGILLILNGSTNVDGCLYLDFRILSSISNKTCDIYYEIYLNKWEWILFQICFQQNIKNLKIKTLNISLDVMMPEMRTNTGLSTSKTGTCIFLCLLYVSKGGRYHFATPIGALVKEKVAFLTSSIGRVNGTLIFKLKSVLGRKMHLYPCAHVSNFTSNVWRHYYFNGWHEQY